MGQKILGGCSCRAIRYEATAEPMAMVNCHCRDCQRATGSAYGAYLMFAKNAVRVEGEPRYHTTIGNAGRSVERGFCAVCGSPVAVKLAALPDAIGFLAASLDDPSLYKPSQDIYTDSAQAWDTLHPATKKVPQGIF